MLTAQSGRPWTMLPVPSIGSIDHRRGPRAALRGVFLAGQGVVGEPRAQPVADQALEVLIEVGHVAQVGLLVGRDPPAARQGHLGGLEGQGLDELQLRGEVERIGWFRETRPSGALPSSSGGCAARKLLAGAARERGRLHAFRLDDGARGRQEPR